MVWPVFKTAMEAPSAAPVGSIPTRSRHPRCVRAGRCSPLFSSGSPTASSLPRPGFGRRPAARAPPLAPGRAGYAAAPLHQPAQCVLALVPAPGLGAGPAEPEAVGGNLRRLGRGDPGYEPEDPERAGATSGARLRPGPRTSARSTRTGWSCWASITCSPASRPTSPLTSPIFPATSGFEAVPGGVAPRLLADSAAMNPHPIGVFDSGIGGLTVRARSTSACRTSPPSTSATRRACPTAPSRPRRCGATASRSCTGCCAQGVKAVVVACNTSTAHALETLQAESPVPVHRRDRAGSAARRPRHDGGPIGVIGTAGTIASNAYNRAIQAARPVRRSSSAPVRSSSRWSRRAGSTIRRPS